MKMAIFATIMTACLLMTGLGATAQETEQIPSTMNSMKITEFLYNPVGTELDGEFVELENVGNATVDISGWTLSDQDGSIDMIFHNITISPGGLAVVFSRAGNNSRDGTNETHWLYMNKTSSVWSNTGDDILLCDFNGTPVDYVSYSDGSGRDPLPARSQLPETNLPEIVEGNSYSLIDGNWTETIPSPGRVPAPASKMSEIVISQICPSVGDGGEFAAIENRGASAIDIGFFALTDGEGRAAFPPGTIIASSQIITVAKNATTYENLMHEAPDFCYATNMLAPKSSPSLSNDGDELFFIAPDFSIIDAVCYGDSTYNGTGWQEQPAIKPKTAQILKRKGGPDTNTSADWEDNSTHIAGQTSFSTTTYSTKGTITTFLSPDCSMDVIIGELANATESIRINIYEFFNEALGSELIAAVARGVNVTLFIEGEPVGGLTENGRLFLNWLHTGGIDIRLHKSADDNPAERYRFNHAKYMVIDVTSVIVMTENWGYTGVPLAGYAGNRGWGTVIRDADVAARYSELFDADSNTSWHDVISFNVDATEAAAIFGPDESRSGITPEFGSTTIGGVFNITPIIVPDQTLKADDPILAVLENATASVLVEQFYIDTNWGDGPNVYLEEVIDAARRGCDVRVLLDASYYNTMSTDLNDNDDTVRYINTLARTEGLVMSAKLVRPDGHTFTKIHAKGMVVDGSHTLISSINWNRNSVTRNREVGVIVENTDVAAYFTDAFESDWLDRVHDPQPVIELEGILKAGRNITFSAKNSTASSNFTAHWDFDGDNKVEAVNQTVIWQFDCAGQYIVTLEIEDIWGNKNSTSLIVEIGEADTAPADEETDDEPVVYISAQHADQRTVEVVSENTTAREITQKDMVTAAILLIPMLLVMAITIARRMRKR